MSDDSDTTTMEIADINSLLQAAEQEVVERSACVVVLGGELNGTVLDLPAGAFTFGRAPGADYTLEFSGVSRLHMRMVVDAEGARLLDLGSRNGTLLNDTIVSEPVLLKKGDVIKLGTLTLRFLPKGDPERLAYEKLSRRANTDSLTGCSNRSFFTERLNVEVKKTTLTGRPLSLIALDLDGFKAINDTYGHDAGDAVLSGLAALIRETGVRQTDVFARLGGDEFVVLLPGIDASRAAQVGERLRRSIEAARFVYEAHSLGVTISLGVAEFCPEMLGGAALFKAADQALYRSKRAGQNRVSVAGEHSLACTTSRFGHDLADD